MVRMMSSQKSDKTPPVIWTRPEAVIYELSEIPSFIGKRVLLVIHHAGVDLEIIGVALDEGRLQDLPSYAAKNRSISFDLNETSFTLMSAVVLDPENLPYEINAGEEVFVIYDEWNFNGYSTMEAAARNIEYTIGMRTNSQIEDFIVLVGREFPQIVTKKFLHRLHRIEHRRSSSLYGG
jgi:hypothetical protein